MDHPGLPGPTGLLRLYDGPHPQLSIGPSTGTALQLYIGLILNFLLVLLPVQLYSSTSDSWVLPT